MPFCEFIPAPVLRPYIQCYWHLDDEYRQPIQDRFYPNGCVKLVFSLDLDVERMDEQGTLGKEPWTEVIGPMTKPYQISAKGRGQTFCIRFFPHGFSRFFRLPLYELNDITLDAAYVLGNDFVGIVGECLQKGTIHSLIEVIDAFLIKRLIQMEGDSKDIIVAYAVRQIFKFKGSCNLDRITTDCKISSRYLQAIFQAKVGFSPKLLIRIIRFQQAIKHIQDPHVRFTDLAYDFGYYDQAHFLKDFKQFTSTTPSLLVKQDHPMNKFFLDPASCSFFYNFLLDE